MEFEIKNDQPTFNDGLGRGTLAKGLANVVRACEPPFVLGMYGGWGIGKTTLMHLVDKELIGSSTVDGVSIKTIWFDPWFHQYDENPAVALLHKIAEEVGVAQDAKKLLSIIGMALSSSLMNAFTSLSLSEIQSLGEKYEQEHFQVREIQIQLKQHLNKLIDMATKSGQYRLVIFVDDIDRCLPKYALSVLESLKLYLDDPRCVYVLGMDKVVLERSIKHQYRDLNISETEYLDKLIQLPFNIPPTTSKSLDQYIDNLLPKSLSEAGKILSIGLNGNPRSIKRFVNVFILSSGIVEEILGDMFDCRLMAIVLIIQNYYSELFREVSKSPEVLTEIIKSSNDTKNQLSSMSVRFDDKLLEVFDYFKCDEEYDLRAYLHYSISTAAEVTLCNVYLTNSGPDKLKSARAVAQVFGLGFEEAKDLLSKPPVQVASEVRKSEAEAIKDQLGNVGVTINCQ